MPELWQQGAGELAQTFRSGDASATEIVSAHLARIDAVNDDVNAIVRRIDNRALARAAEVDDARSAGTPLGPLAGVPFTIKDNIDLAGDPTTQAIAALADFVPKTNAPVVERMIEAGAIPLARTNLPDIGMRMATDSSLHGLTRNPWDPTRTAGGSSGGEAAAIATGMSPFGLGNDLGGSLRNPATCCSIASLKPTLGRVPHAVEGLFSDESMVSQLIAVEGPMARTVADVRLELGVIAGAHPRDPWSVPAAFGERPSPLRVALVADPPGGQTDPRIAAATEEAGAWLRDAGHLVEPVAPDTYEATLDCWKTLVIGDIRDGLEELREISGPELMAFLEGAVESADVGISADDIRAAWSQRLHLIASWNQFFAEFDAVLTPTWAQLPFLHGADAGAAGAAATVELARPVLPANVLGLPAAAVPATLIDGVPVGMMVTGPAWSDLTCLTIAADIEARNDVPPTPIDPRGTANG
jgi:amidase